MAFPESLSWIFKDQEAEELLEKLRPGKQPQQLVTGTRHPMNEVHRLVVEKARKRKAMQIADQEK